MAAPGSLVPTVATRGSCGPLSGMGHSQEETAISADFGDAVRRGQGLPLMAGTGAVPEPGFALPTGTVTFLLMMLEGFHERPERTP